MSRPLYTIAKDIRAFWPNISPHAKPYLLAMDDLEKLDDMYYADTGETIVLYFLANASTWRGAEARIYKAELNAMLKGVKHAH